MDVTDVQLRLDVCLFCRGCFVEGVYFQRRCYGAGDWPGSTSQSPPRSGPTRPSVPCSRNPNCGRRMFVTAANRIVAPLNISSNARQHSAHPVSITGFPLQPMSPNAIFSGPSLTMRPSVAVQQLGHWALGHWKAESLKPWEPKGTPTPRGRSPVSRLQPRLAH